MMEDIEAVKLGLKSKNIQQQIASLSQLIKYGETGLELVIQTLKDESWLLQHTAFLLLRQKSLSQIPKVKKALKEYIIVDSEYPDDRPEVLNFLSKSPSLRKCEFCSHIFRPLEHELKVIEAEIDENGYIIRHHRAICPACGSVVTFSTKERDGATHGRVKVRLAVGRITELVEINLQSTSSIINQVYRFIKTQPSILTPEKIYSAIFKEFIEIIDSFTLGDWRRIVKLVEPTNTISTKIAWELYQEGKVRHQNRLAALAAVEKRQLLEQQKLKNRKSKPEQVVATKAGVTTLPAVGNPDVQKKYASAWKLFLSRCHHSTADFLDKNAGLFSVQDSTDYCNVSIALRNVPELKTQRIHLKEAELSAALTEVFGKKAFLMFRLSS